MPDARHLVLETIEIEVGPSHGNRHAAPRNIRLDFAIALATSQSSRFACGAANLATARHQTAGLGPINGKSGGGGGGGRGMGFGGSGGNGC